MQHLLNEMGIPTLWHKSMLLAVWFTVVWVIARIKGSQITKSELDNDVSYKAKKAITAMPSIGTFGSRESPFLFLKEIDI